MANKLNSECFDIKKALQDDGVYAYGFGHIAKVAMLDRDLSCTAKGIYAYFCSYASTKNSAYPKLSTILNDLGLNKRTYYKHFDQLTENGYITIKKADGFKNKNIYIINEYVKKVNCDISKSDESESVFIVDGIKAHGYGTIPKLAMIDKRLTIKAKALMAFLLSLSGAGKCAFPRRDVICMQLNVSKNTYVSMMNELISYGYIRITQRRTRNGAFAVNDYHFEVNPVEKKRVIDQEHVDIKISNHVDNIVERCGNIENTVDNDQTAATKGIGKNGLNSEFSPCPKNCTFLESGLNSGFSPCPKNCTFLESNRVPKTALSPCPKNCTNNNINSNNNTVLLCTSIPYPNKVIMNNMPKETELKDLLHIISNYEYYKHFADAYAQKHCKVVDILFGLFSEDSIIHKNVRIETTNLWRYFVHILMKNYPDEKPCVDFIYDVLLYYDQCISMYIIEYPARYLRSLVIDKIINDYDECILLYEKSKGN